MAATKYTYSVSADFPGQEVNGKNLITEIHASDIVTALDHVDVTGDDVDIWFKDALSSGDEDLLDAVVAAHDSTQSTGKFSFSSDGALVISPTYSSYEEDAAFQGFLVSGSGEDTDTIYDHLITNQIYMGGGHYWSSGGQLGDYAEASIVDKDDILGLFSTYGLTQGVDVLELFKFASGIYLNPNGTDFAELMTPDAALVYPGLYLRTKLHTAGATQCNLGVTYFWFEV